MKEEVKLERRVEKVKKTNLVPHLPSPPIYYSSAPFPKPSGTSGRGFFLSFKDSKSKKEDHFLLDVSYDEITGLYPNSLSMSYAAYGTATARVISNVEVGVGNVQVLYHLLLSLLA